MKKQDVREEVAAIQARLAKAKPKAKKQFSSWSFSRYSDYKRCPLKAKLKHLDKVAEPPNPAMSRGADIGRLAELYIKGKLPKLPQELSRFGKKFAELRALMKKHPQRVVVEDQWAFDKDWNKSRWDDWDRCVVRVKIDAGHMTGPKSMEVVDWKTGKFRPDQKEDYLEQLELYALSALLLNTEVEEVKTYLYYLDAGVVYPSGDEEMTYTRADVPKLKKAWDRRTRAMLLDKAFAPRPNDLCNWCHYRKDNAANGGGQCRY